MRKLYTAYLVLKSILRNFNILKPIRSTVYYVKYFSTIKRYEKLDGAELIKLKYAYPIFHEDVAEQHFEPHYFYQGIWAFKKINSLKKSEHVDIGSQIDLIGFLTAITKVTYIDIRPLNEPIENFKSIAGSILNIPFKDNSINSLSCLHVAEHIGLGRYGDPLNPLGTKQACEELSRVLAVEGDLFFSLPIGFSRICFNAHRVHTPTQIINYFKNLTLVDFSVVTDEKKLLTNVDPLLFENQSYACGLFHFKKTK